MLYEVITFLEHVQSKRPGLVRVQHDACAREAMNRAVNALRRELDHSYNFV